MRSGAHFTNAHKSLESKCFPNNIQVKRSERWMFLRKERLSLSSLAGVVSGQTRCQFTQEFWHKAPLGRCFRCFAITFVTRGQLSIVQLPKGGY